jgi:hypothetical protein
LTLLLLLGSACAAGDPIDVAIIETTTGGVYLERFSDLSFTASHPVTVGQKMMSRILRGLQVDQEPGLFQRFRGGHPLPEPVFSEEEVSFLAPLLSEGLARAASDQKVMFKLFSASPSRGDRVGTLYAYGTTLYFTLPSLISESRYGAGGSAPTKTLISIIPSSDESQSTQHIRSTDNTIAIDLRSITSTHTVPQEPGTPSAASGNSPDRENKNGQLHALEEQLSQKLIELEALRKELQDIRRQIVEPKSGFSRSPSQ